MFVTSGVLSSRKTLYGYQSISDFAHQGAGRGTLSDNSEFGNDDMLALGSQAVHPTATYIATQITYCPRDTSAVSVEIADKATFDPKVTNMQIG